MGRFETLSRPFRNLSAVIAEPGAKAPRGGLFPRTGECRPGQGMAITYPGYWRKRRVALQDLSLGQAVDSTYKKANFASPPLQEILSAQPAVLIGLIAHLTGRPLQHEIVRTTDRLLGQDILATSAARMAPMTEPDSGHDRDRLRDIL